MSISSLARQTNVSINIMMQAIREDTQCNQTTVQHKGGKKTKVKLKPEADQIDGKQKGSKKGRFGQFPCDICKKVLRSRVAIKDHKRTHTGKKPFPWPNVLDLIGRDEEPLGIFFQEQGTKIFTKAKM